MIIYKVSNKKTGKSYIGKTILSISKRISNHLNEAQRNKKRYVFHNALIKYGIDNFNIEVLCHCSNKDNLSKMETFYIQYYNTHYLDGYGYNMSYGGDGQIGHIHTKETRRKMSLAQKERHKKFGHPLSGKHLTEKHKHRLSLFWKGKERKKWTAEQKRKASEFWKGKRSGKNNSMYGRKRIFSDETKKKISEAVKLAWQKRKENGHNL